MVNFIIRQDTGNRLQFAALQSKAGERLLKKYNLPQNDISSFILIQNEEVFMRSTAALKVLHQLPWYWKWTQLFWIVPTSIRDAIYNFIADHRYKWFGKAEQCMIPTPEVRSRFLEK